MNDKRHIQDVQGMVDERKIYINKVGVKNVAFRCFFDVQGKKVFAQGLAHCYASLNEDEKGTHMSRMARMIAGLTDQELNLNNLNHALNNLRDSLRCSNLILSLDLDCIREKYSPVSKIKGYESFMIYFESVVSDKGADHKLTIELIGTSLCPASKTNSNYGAHNQRSLVRVKLPYTNFAEVLKNIEYIESCLSSPVYPILKLVDELKVTEQAYENPRFVEDIVRDIAVLFKANNIPFEEISCENMESIHTHNAYALIQ